MNKKFVHRAAAAVAAVGIVAATATSAQALSNTWLNGPMQSTKTYYEPSSSWQFSRTGVNSQIAGASGGTWRTVLWLGDKSTTGTAGANLSGPLSNNRTKVKWTFLPNPSETKKMTNRVTITGIPSGGMRVAPEVGSKTSALPKGLDTSGLEADGAQLSTAEEVGTIDSVSFWKANGEGESIHLIAVDGKTLASTHTTKQDLAAYGLTLRLDTEDKHVQGVLVSGRTSKAPGNSLGVVSADTETTFLQDKLVDDKDRKVAVTTQAGTAATADRAAEKITLFGDPEE